MNRVFQFIGPDRLNGKTSALVRRGYRFESDSGIKVNTMKRDIKISGEDWRKSDCIYKTKEWEKSVNIKQWVHDFENDCYIITIIEQNCSLTYWKPNNGKGKRVGS